MKRTSTTVASVMGLLVLLTAVLRAEDAAKKTESVKPPWQRLLQGEDAKKAAEEEKKLAQLQEAGQFAEALKVAEALAELRAKSQGADHWQAVDARFAVEAIHRVRKENKDEQQIYHRSFALGREAKTLWEKGRYREAQPLFQQVLTIRRKVLGEEYPYTATSYNSLASNLNDQGKYQEAEKAYGKALAIRRKVLGEENPNTASSYDGLALALKAQGKYQDAEKGFAKALAIRRKVLGEEDPDTATSYNNVAFNLSAQGKFQKAEEGYGKALKIRRKVLGEEHPNTALSYLNLASNLYAQGRYHEAENGFGKALAICCKVLGEEHPYTATAYNNLALSLDAQGKHKEAEESYGKALTIRRKVLGEQHPDTAATYNNVASNLNIQGKYQEAEKNLGKALAIFRKVLGEEHPHTATGYNNLAHNLKTQGKYREAEEGFRKALAIRLKALGEEHPAVASSYDSLALNLNTQGKYQEAEKGFAKALAIRRKVLGEEHPDTAISYNNLALNLKSQGKYQEAEKVFGKASAIWRKALGEEHPNTAISYFNLASNLKAQGKYQEAEEGFSKTLAIWRKVLGEEHPYTATGYNSLASNLKAQGKYQEAEQGYRTALAIHRKVLGEEHPDTAQSYHGLASNLTVQGKYQEAEEGFRKALAIRRKVLGEEHPDTASSYNSLASNLKLQGKYQEAEEDFNKALAIWRKALGEEHPDLATVYNNLASNLDVQGKHQEAEKRFGKALAIRRKVLGEEHPHTAQCYTNLALNLHSQGKYQEAETIFLRAAGSFAKARLHVAATGLERATFTSKNSPLLALATVLAQNGKPEEAWQRFEESLARGTWDDVSARLRWPQAERDRQTQIAARIDRLNQLLAKTNAAKPTPEQTKQREELLSQLRQAYDELAAFAQQLEKKYGPIAGQVFSRGQIQAALPADAALIAWLDFASKLKAADPNEEHWAILLRNSGAPIWLRLRGSGDNGAWTEADTKLPVQLRAALQTAESDWQPLSKRLRKQRLDPLTPYLEGVRRLIMLPSLALAGVPLEVIADGYTVSYAHSGTMYAYLLHQPSPTGKGLLALADPVFEPAAEKEKSQPLPPGGVLLTMVLPGSNAASAGLKPNDVLLRYGETEVTKPTDVKPQAESGEPQKLVPVVVWREGRKLARPLFVRPGKLGVVFATEPAPEAVAEQRRMDRLVSRGSDGGTWPRLPGTRFEVASLQRLFGKDTPIQLLLGSDSSEERLNELAKRGEVGKYRYVHLATHGEVNDAFPLRSAVILSRDHLPDDKRRTELLLAGQPIPDGRLTAEEVLRRWNLHCDLVTLSACQTALGKYELGEGFVGFAQALILCGTHSVCLSLWKVDDLATALLMTRFYENLLGTRKDLKEALPKAAALREAKNWLRGLRRAERDRLAASFAAGELRGTVVAAKPVSESPKETAKTPYAHPRYWAAFILIGDPG